MDGYSVVTNRCPVIPNRGIGKPGMCYIWERHHRPGGAGPGHGSLGGTLPQPGPAGADALHPRPNGNVYDSGDYPGLLKRALEKVDYQGLKEEQARERENGRYLGIGVVIGVEPGGRNAARDMAIFPEMKETPGGRRHQRRHHQAREERHHRPVPGFAQLRAGP